MNGRLSGWRNRVLGLIALAVFAVLPSAAAAEDLYFRNDTGVAIVVQGSCIIRGKIVKDRPNLVLPGKAVRVALPGNKSIDIRQAQAPNSLLHQENIPAGAQDLYILIKLDPPLKLKLDRTTAKEFAGGKN
jgi:hypothetical protein